MLRKKEKKAIASIFMLMIGWPVGLDQFFEGKNEKGISTTIGWTLTAFLSWATYNYWDRNSSCECKKYKRRIKHV